MNQQEHRKNEHVSLATKQFQEETATATRLAEVRLVPHTMPEINLDAVDLTTTIAGQKTTAPFFINAMTGGTPETGKLNQQLATAAKETGIAMATGSESVALRSAAAQPAFTIVRQVNPAGVVLGNVSATTSPNAAQKAVDLINANALEVHVNAAQELTMPEGETAFHWQENIVAITQRVTVPVIIKEVGQGVDPRTLHTLSTLPVAGVDLGGRGGTNFITIENERRPHQDMAYLKEWGLTTAENLLIAKKIASNLTITATGGIHTPLDVAKCLALGADNVGIAGFFLHILIKHDLTTLVQTIEWFKDQLKRIMVLCGCKTIAELQRAPYLLSPALQQTAEQLLTIK
ncbi:type 2 isopentenyl-diphosphate Delta-isomerase [Ligilactobacillus sp. LYQ60]|uniref:type 2 isopentenyl-diphosphate Delta-isomerase n=1 Tax=unclassified Ligilactobacillus TaxID=2767920 RepID=UPI0038530297